MGTLVSVSNTSLSTGVHVPSVILFEKQPGLTHFLLYQFAITKYHSPVASTTKFISHCSGGWKSDIKVPADSVLLWVCRGAFSLGPCVKGRKLALLLRPRSYWIRTPPYDLTEPYLLPPENATSRYSHTGDCVEVNLVAGVGGTQFIPGFLAFLIGFRTCKCITSPFPCSYTPFCQMSLFSLFFFFQMSVHHQLTAKIIHLPRSGLFPSLLHI